MDSIIASASASEAKALRRYTNMMMIIIIIIIINPPLCGAGFTN